MKKSVNIYTAVIGDKAFSMTKRTSVAQKLQKFLEIAAGKTFLTEDEAEQLSLLKKLIGNMYPVSSETQIKGYIGDTDVIVYKSTIQLDVELEIY